MKGVYGESGLQPGNGSESAVHVCVYSLWLQQVSNDLLPHAIQASNRVAFHLAGLKNITKSTASLDSQMTRNKS